MEGRKRSCMLKKSVYNMRKRLVALALAAAMVCTNVGADLNAAYAATSSSESVTFEMTGSQLVTAIEEAIENGNVISPGYLDFTNGDIAKFESLFYGEGKVLEVFPDPDGGSMDAELRVFVRLPEDADDMYMVTGDEEIIFLYVNNGEDTVSFSTTIYDDEGGKLKSTKAIRVKSFEDAFGEEEINYISKPTETTAPAEDNGPAKEESTAPTESETAAPEEGSTAAPEEGSTAAPEEGTTAAPDEGTTVAPEETTTAAEESSSEAPSESETDSTTEAEQTEPETTEAPETTEEKTQETETSEAEVAEPENTTGEPVASITRHYAPIVADNEEGGVPEQPKADAAEEHVEEPKETTKAEVETEEKEPETTEKATEPTEVTDSTDSTEATKETSTTVPDATTEAGGEDVNSSKSTSADETTTAPTEDEETATAVETPEVTEPVQAGTPSEVTKPEEMKPEENVNKAEKNDIVGMGYCSTAKAYVTKLKDLKVLKGQLELSATVDGAENVNVTLTANPGVVPQGSYIEATAIIDDSELELMKEAANEKLNRQNLAAVDIFAADVKLFDADGNEIQPKGSVRVAFEGTEINSSESVVYHMDDENSGISTLSLDAAEPNPYTAETVTNVDAGSDEAAFVTNHFSIYAEIETEERYYYEVNFWYAEDGQNKLISGPQYVEEGHDAILPAAPEFDGYVFVGWDPSPQNISGDSDIYARYSKTADLIRLTVNYIYSDGTVAAQPWVAEVQAGVNCNYTIASPEIAGFVADQTVVGFNGVYSGDQTVTVTYKGGETQYQVKHYLLNPDGSQPSEPVITETLTGEVGLNTQAAAKEYEGFTPKPIAQVAIGSDGRTVVEVHYERNLYTLTWDTGDGGSYIAPTEVVYGAAVDEPVEKPTRLGYEFLGWETVPATMPAQDTVVTAKWQSVAEADYKVVYWKETLTVGEYAVADITYGQNGTVGNDIPTQNKTYEGFALNEQKSAGSIKITADGLAVKNVYYDREQYTIKFYRQKDMKWQEDTSLRITERYGVDVSKEWEKACAKDGWGPNKNDNVQYTLIANMPAENLDMYRKAAGSGKKIYYYVEGLTQGEKLTYAAFDAQAGVKLTVEDKMPITGFTFDSWQQNSSWLSRNLWLYYTRNSYELFFENCATMNPEKIKFEAPLSTGKPDGEPGRPANIDNDYKFAGWYLDPGFTTAVDWDSRMPAEGVTIYAKWEIPKYDVMFETNGGDSIDKITVKKGDVLPDLQVPKKTGDVFLGWYTDPQMTKKYIAESKIVKDTILYARWESSDTVNYTVKYVSSADGSVIAPKETRNAELGSTVSEAAKSIDNYYPKATVLTVKITERDQEIVFEYTPVEKWTYTVKYLLEGTQDAVPGSSLFENETSDHELAVNFKSFEGYTLVSAPVVSVTKERPEAVFFYREKKAIYHTQHWFERVSYVDENERFGLHDITTTTGVESGIPVSAQALEPVPEGFTLDTSIAGTIASGTTNIQNILTMKLFYVRSSYDVKYVIDGPQPEGVIVPTGGSYKYKETVTLEPTLSVPGYTFIGWETDDVALSNGKFMMPTHDVTLKGRFVENAAVEIRYVPDDAEHGSTTNSPDEVSPATGTPKGSIATAKEGYAFKNWTKDGEVVSWNAELKPEDIEKVGGVYVASEYVANFGVDDNGDQIPDEYQIKVTYSAVNGSVDLTEAQYVTLYKDGHYATKEEGGVGTLTEAQIATATAANGYNQASESWNPEKPEAGTTQFTEDTHYTISFAENAAVEITYVPDDAEHGSTTNSPDMVKPVSGTPRGSVATAKEGYAFKNWTKDGEVVSWNAELKPEDIEKVGGVYVASEYVANFGVDDNGDQIPDEYQIKVTYSAVNGSVDLTEAQYVTLYKDGHYATKEEGGVGTLTEAQIATATAANGYNQASESWNPEKPEAGTTQFTEDTHYTISFAENAAVEITYVPDDAEHGSTTNSPDMVKPVSGTPRGSVATAKEGYAFKNWTKDGEVVSWNAELKPEDIEKVGGVYVASEYVANFGVDDNGDQIPDEYQIKVTYSAVNGSVDLTEAQYVTLYKDGHYATKEEGGVGTLTEAQIATATAANGYNQASESWNPEKPEAGTTQFTEDTHYTISFAENAAVEITYVPDDAEHGSTTNSPDMVKPVSGTPRGSVATAKEGYAFKNWTKDGEVVSWNAELKPEDIEKVGGVYVASEYVANFGVDDNGDQIPDEYQIKVTYSAVNGSVDLTEAQYVTLYKDGHYATKEEGGVGTLTEAQIATATAANGYNQASESWNPEKPEAGTTQFTEDTHYTISFAENAAVEITYVPDDAEHGSTTNSPDMVKPVSGTPRGSVATAKEGYAFKNWTKDGEVVSWNAELKPEDIAKVGGLYVASEYVANFGVDDNGDQIPDEYQTIFYYISADETKGTVSTVEEVHTFRDENGHYTEKTAISPDGATAIAKDGNAFEYWIDNETKDPTSDMSILKSKQYLEDTTFTAYFDSDEKGKGPDGNEPDGVPDKYETIFVYKSADVTKGTVDADPLEAEVHVFKDVDGNYTEKTPVSPKGANATALDGFAFDYWTDREVNDYTPDMSKMKLNTYLVDTTFTAYFDVDEIGTEEPNTPDGVPDKYQIMFQYVSEDTNHGTVIGAVTEVRTIYEIVTGEDGNDHRELRPARPSADVTVSSVGRYSFNNWTDGSRSYADANEIKAAEFIQSTTFTAQFNYNGGGGGGGTGGGPTTGGGRYTGTPGGPGSTTITPEDVPLAPLPELPVDVTLIDDDEVPLAPLPKTGQTSKRTTLTMILSGILVAVTALSRKRKEEDS